MNVHDDPIRFCDAIIEDAGNMAEEARRNSRAQKALALYERALYRVYRLGYDLGHVGLGLDATAFALYPYMRAVERTRRHALRAADMGQVALAIKRADERYNRHVAVVMALDDLECSVAVDGRTVAQVCRLILRDAGA